MGKNGKKILIKKKGKKKERKKVYKSEVRVYTPSSSSSYSPGSCSTSTLIGTIYF